MWEIYAYQNADSLSGIFNAIAAIMGSSTYVSAIAAVAFCGFVAALAAYAFAPERLQGWKWIGTVVLVYGVLLVPKVTVGVVDKTGGSAVRIVDNVPFGLALFGSLTSTIGNTLTDLFETGFQAIPGPGGLASDFTYQNNGVMFGNRMIKAAGAVSIPDPNVRTDIINFVHNCTMYDLADGTLDPAVFSKSGDVWGLMGTPNPARFTSITSASGVTNMTCPDAYSNLSGRLPGQVTAIQNTLALQMNPTLPAAAAMAAIGGQIEQAYIRNQIASVSATAADLIRQNAMINAINDTSQLTGQVINDPASMILAVGRAQAVAQQNASWINGAKVTEQALPIVRNVIEALTYALFPLWVMLLFLTHGRETAMAVKGYVVVLIWIQLWPPIYAILNYMSTIYAQFDLASAAEVGGGAKALALLSSSTIYSSAISGQAVVGWMVTSIPFIAWAAMKRLETFGSVLASGMSNIQSTVGSATASATSGNVALGDVTMDQRVVSPSTSNPWVSSAQDRWGNWQTSDGMGRHTVKLLRNEGFGSRTVTVQMSEEAVEAASRSVESSRVEALSAIREESAVLANVLSRSSSRTASGRSSTGSTTSSTAESGSDAQTLDNIVNSVARTTGIDRSQVAQIAFTAAVRGSAYAGLEASAKVGTPDILPASVGVRANAGAQVNMEAGASAGKSYNAKLQESEQKVLSHLSNEQVAAFKRFADRVTHDQSYVNSVATDDRDAKDISSRLSSATSKANRAEAAFAERLSRAEEVRAAYKRGDSFTIDLAADPRFVGLQEEIPRWIERWGQDSQALSVVMSSEVARHGLPPTSAFPSGAALPNSFDDVRHDHAEASNDSRLRPTVGRSSRISGPPGNRSDAAADAHPAAPAPSALDAGALRREIVERQQKISGENRQLQGGFEESHGITHSDTGTPGTKRSLLGDAGKQVVVDGANVAREAKDAIAGSVKSIKEDLRDLTKTR